MKFKFLSILSALGLVLTMQNCGDFSALQDESFIGGLDFGSSPIDANASGQRLPFQMLTKKQVISSMVTAAGLTEADATFIAASAQFSPILSERPELSEYNAPRAMSYSNLSGSACRQLIAQEKKEKNKRLIRYGLPTNYSDITKVEIDETIRSFARSFWSRNETNEEYDIIIESLDDYIDEIASLSEPVKSERQTIFLCTAMLASLDAITY